MENVDYVFLKMHQIKGAFIHTASGITILLFSKKNINIEGIANRQ